MVVSSTISGYKYKYLEGNLTISPFRKTASIDSLLEHMSSLAIGFDHAYSTRHEFPLVEQYSDSSKEG